MGVTPSGLCVKVFFACIGGGSETLGISFRFDPGAAANAVVNIGRGASFGLSDKESRTGSRPAHPAPFLRTASTSPSEQLARQWRPRALRKGRQPKNTGDETEITFGHGARHLIGTGLDEGDVQSVITSQVRESISGAQPSGSFWGRG